MVAAWSTAMFWEVFAHPCKCKLLLKLRLCYAVYSLQRLNITHFIQLSSQWLILHVIWYSLSHILLHFIPPLIVRPIWKSLFIILQLCRWFTHASGTRGLRYGWFTVFIHKWRHFWQIWGWHCNCWHRCRNRFCFLHFLGTHMILVSPDYLVIFQSRLSGHRSSLLDHYSG